MRLLTHDENGRLVLKIFDGNPLPAYAILSHTWLQDNTQEVSFQDLETGRAADKPGYAKIQFCAKQAAEDGLRYFWVDTCCINKSSDPELSEAINSMFRWYQQATRCYVYLADVFVRGNGAQKLARNEWEPAVRQSRWFTRGWTLQELLAPRVVEFYTHDGERLGDKSSLEQLLCDVTGIDREALRGGRLDGFSFDKKMQWVAGRSTKRAEDAVYSMLGIFGTSMPLVYGEGRERALQRLRREIDDARAASGSDEHIVSLDMTRMPNAAQFVARESELTDMHKLLFGRDGRSVTVLHGLGGIGKTQLAVTYIRRHKTKYSALFWVDADSDDSIRSSFRGIAQQILAQHPSASSLASVDLEGDPARTVEAVLLWLGVTRNTQWLLVYDNYDSPKIAGHSDPNAVDLRPYMPQCDHGSILITTRSSQVTLGSRIHVKKLSDAQEGLAILSHASQRKDIQHDPVALALVKELDGLPLALSTAGAYLEQVTTSFAEYHHLYRESWLELQKRSPQFSSYEDRSLYTTWQLSMDVIKRHDESAARLLKLWAYFDRQDVWYELLSHGTTCEWLEKMTESRAAFDETMRLLCSYGLVESNSPATGLIGSTGYSVHSCVHAWSVSVLNEKWDDELARVALDCVASMVPANTADQWWLTQSRVMQHAGQCYYTIEDHSMDTADMEWAMHTIGDLYSDQGKLDEAEKMYVRALQGCEEALGPKHTSTLSTVNNLGLLYADQGKLDEAEKMYVRALQGKEEALGPEHTSTLSTVNNLGNLYKDQGKLDEAEKMYKRALQGYEQALGPKHTSTLSTVNNLGILYSVQGKLDEAEKMYQRALEGYEEALGTELVKRYVPALNTLRNMGDLLSNGRREGAREMYTRALSGYTIVHGASSSQCLDLEQRLAALNVEDTSKAGDDQIPSTRTVSKGHTLGKSNGLRKFMQKLMK